MGCQGKGGGVVRFECINYYDSATGNDRISAGSIASYANNYVAVNTGSYSTNNQGSTYGGYTCDMNAINFK